MCLDAAVLGFSVTEILYSFFEAANSGSPYHAVSASSELLAQLAVRLR